MFLIGSNNELSHLDVDPMAIGTAARHIIQA